MPASDPITKKDLEDVVAEIKVLVRQVQDVLLAHFHNQLKTQTMPMDAREAFDAALLRRLDVLEERVLSLETRPRVRPN